MDADFSFAGQPVLPNQLDALAGGTAVLHVDNLFAGYGATDVLRDLNLRLGQAQWLCLVGPNGSGKSTVLNSIFGFATVRAGRITLDHRDITRMPAEEKLRRAGVGYVLQDNAIFPEMTVEENLLLGGYLLPRRVDARRAVEKILTDYPQLADRCKLPARTLSGGERRLLEIFRALVMEPKLLLVDEPSIGLDPRHIEIVFEVFQDYRRRHGGAILMVEQNARKGLSCADVGYVMAGGKVVLAGTGDELLRDERVGRIFLGG